jgi:hypothetical protein
VLGADVPPLPPDRGISAVRMVADELSRLVPSGALTSS